MRATIKMIAEQAGVSIGTVDRVLHDRPYVKEAVRERVLQVMEELDYRPNRMASALATSGTPRRFVVVQPKWDGYVGREIALGISRFREERRDYNVSVEVRHYPLGQEEVCLQLLRRLLEEPVDGVALCASDCADIREKLNELDRRHVPVVTFNSDITGSRRLCYVGEDGHRAGRIAGEIASKLCRPGDHVQVVYAGPGFVSNKARLDGFLERLRELGFPEESFHVSVTCNDYDLTLAAVSQTLAECPQLRCIYMANLSVPACVVAVRRAGREGQVRVLAHDSSPEISAFLKTGQVDFTIDQNLTYQSHQALSVLFRAVLERKLPEQECFYPGSPILNAETGSRSGEL